LNRQKSMISQALSISAWMHGLAWPSIVDALIRSRHGPASRSAAFRNTLARSGHGVLAHIRCAFEATSAARTRTSASRGGLREHVAVVAGHRHVDRAPRPDLLAADDARDFDHFLGLPAQLGLDRFALAGSGRVALDRFVARGPRAEEAVHRHVSSSGQGTNLKSMAILDLRDIKDAMARVSAGRPAALARLVRAGFPVPPGFVITTEEKEMTPALAAELRRRAAELGPWVAVRSSAVGEDASDASFAGQYETALGVAPETRSAPCSRAGRAPTPSACARTAGDGADGRARAATGRESCAGVLFTVNPTTGSWSEMVIEAAWGQGESVVSGRVVPDGYVVPRRFGRIRDMRSDVHAQTVETIVDAEGRREVEIPASRVGTPKLRRSEVRELCRLGLAIEKELGEPQDIEWALEEGKFLVLQSRPITRRRSVRRSREKPLWTRRFLGERWTEPATPLGWSNMEPILEHFIAYPDTSRRLLGGEPPMRLYRFAPYVDARVFRHLLFKLPGAAPPRFLLDMLPPGEVEAWRRHRAELPDVEVYASILGETLRERRWQRFRWNPFTNWKAWDAFVVAWRRRSAHSRRSDGRRRVARADTMRALVRDYVKVHVASLLFANIWYETAEAALGRTTGPWLAARRDVDRANESCALAPRPWAPERGRFPGAVRAPREELVGADERALGGGAAACSCGATGEGPEPVAEVRRDPAELPLAGAQHRRHGAAVPPAARGPALPLRPAHVGVEEGLRLARGHAANGRAVPRSARARPRRGGDARSGSADRTAARGVGGGDRAAA
jgi:hypothetical protein